MKRTIPLLITFLSGFILIFATFIPYTQDWTNDVVIWFDILASIAFILGGGNLLMMHLKSISDRKAGWGYSAITLISFLVTLVVGTIKYGSAPEADAERYGETAAFLQPVDFPLTFTVSSDIPDDDIPALVRGQISQPTEGTIAFAGWMTEAQKAALEGMEYEQAWHATVETLFQASQPPAELKGKIEYQAQLERLFFRGVMAERERDVLRALGKNAEWNADIDSLFEISNTVHAVPLEKLPEGYTIPEGLRSVVSFDAQAHTLQMIGPMSFEQESVLVSNFPKGGVLSDAERQEMRKQLEALGPFPDILVEELNKYNKEEATAGKRNHDLLFELLRVAQLHPGVELNDAQKQFLLKEYDVEMQWQMTVGELLAASHQTKFPHSGSYDSEGSVFWYIYEYSFKPLTATMFALLAFYVASAAYRAFRAKNIEATLLLGTAFIVLLGRTYLGTWLTSWMPANLSGLTIPELTLLIMVVFTTAGNRAIMIGIALGVVSQSLRILLGIDRSYLGSDRE